MDAVGIDPRQVSLSRTYNVIRRRMKNLGVDIDLYMDFEKTDPLRAWNHTLAGIQFDIMRYGISPHGAIGTGRQLLLMALDRANKGGKKSFRRGKVDKNPHLPVDVSMLFTDGVGYREIYYFDASHVSDTRRRTDMMTMGQDGFDHGFAARFGGAKRIDISSMHVDVGEKVCGIHIDETGFVFEPVGLTGGDVWISLDFLQHTVYELLARDIGGMPANIEIYVPNANNAYGRAGVRANLQLAKQLRVVVDKSVSVNLPKFWKMPEEASVTVSLAGGW